jgi:O-antigen ligase
MAMADPGRTMDFAPAPQALPTQRPATLTQSAEPAVTAPSILERAFVIITGCVFGIDLFRMLGDPNGSGARVAYVPFYLAICAALVLQRSTLARNWRRLLPILVVVLLPLCTVLWSIDPRATIVRGSQLAGSSLFGIYIATRFGLTRGVQFLAISYCIVAVVCVAAVFLWPGFATTGGIHGMWRGLYVHKNGLGAAAAAGLILCWYALATARGATRYVLVFGLVMLALLLLGSRSATSLLALAAAAAAAIIVQIGNRLSRYAVGAFLIAAAAIVIVLDMAGIAPVDWLQLVGRDSSLTGRLPIWELSWEAILRRPWLGYGFDAFWANGSAELARISEQLNYSPYYSHSGALELLLNGGAIIAVLVVVHVVTTVRGAARWASHSTAGNASLPFAFGIYFVVMNVSESKIWAPNDLVWSVWIMFAAFLATSTLALPRRLPTTFRPNGWRVAQRGGTNWRSRGLRT